MQSPEHLLNDLQADDAWVRELARRLVADRADAEDVAQDAWLRALSRRPAERGSLRRWLSTVVRNLAISRLRSSNRRQDRERAASSPDPLPSVTEVLDRENTRHRVAEAVASLDEPYRSAIVYRYLEGHPPREIAARLGVTGAAIESRLRRGLEKLRARLDRDFGDRKSWCAALLPLIGHGLTEPAAAGAATLATGALVMSTKAKIGIAVLVTLGVACAFWLRDEGRPPKVPNAEVVKPAAAVPKEAKGAESAGPDQPRATANVVQPQPEAVSKPISLESTRRCIAGVVTDQRGVPISGATVRLIVPSYDGTSPLDPRIAGTTQTHADGTYEFDHPVGFVLVEVTHPEYFTAEKLWSSNFRDPSLDFVIGRGGSIHGMVRRNRQPVANAAVKARGGAFDPRSIRAVAVTGPDGRFRLSRVAPGLYYLGASPPDGPGVGFPKLLRVVTGQDTEASIDLPGMLPNSIFGVVTGGPGQLPLEGAEVFVYPNWNHRVTTDVHGRYRLTNLGASSRVVVWATAPGYVLQTAVVSVCDNSNLTRDFSLVRRATVSGRVLSGSGEPVSGAVVAASDSDLRTEQRFVLTDSDGCFETTWIRPGKGREVWATAKGLARGKTRILALEAGKRLSDVTIVLDGGGTVKGRVCDELGAAVALADVRLKGIGHSRRTTTASEGLFEFGQLPAGQYEVDVHARGHVNSVKVVTVEPRGTVTCVFSLSRGLKVAGRVVDARGEGVSARVNLRWENQGAPGPWRPLGVSTDAEGNFSVFGVMPGTYRVHVQPESASFAPTTIVGVPAGTLDLLVRVAAAITLSGRVLPPNPGQLPSGCWLLFQAVGDGGAPGRVVPVKRPGNGGRFTERLPAPGVYRILAGAGEWVSDPVQVHIGKGENDLSPMQLCPGVVIRGKVQHDGGRPVAEAELTLLTPRGFFATGKARRRADENGEFSFRGVPAGAYDLTAKAPSGATVTVRVSATSPENTVSVCIGK